MATANHALRKPIFLGMGIEIDKEPFMTPDGRSLQYHGLMYIIKGAGRFTDAGGVTTPVKAGSVMYIFPDEWHCFDPLPNTRWTELWILFDGRQALEYYGPLLPEKPGVADIGVIDSLRDDWDELADVWQIRRPGFPEYTEFLLHKILMELHRQRNRMVFFRVDDDVESLRSQMRKHLAEPDFDVQDFAHRRNLGYHQLRQRFKVYTGLAPKDYFLQMKVNIASEYLLRSNTTIKEIARRLGFSDQYYFSRLFKLRCGVSPARFRARIVSTYKNPARLPDSES